MHMSEFCLRTFCSHPVFNYFELPSSAIPTWSVEASSFGVLRSVRIKKHLISSHP